MEVNPRRVEQQLRNLQRVLDAYHPPEPFARFLTKFFRENKQMGSSDRRVVSRLSYNLFRLGRSLENLPTLDRVVIAEFLCEKQSDVVTLHQPAWLTHIQLPLKEKIQFLAKQGREITHGLFPFLSPLSASIDIEHFALSHLIQPDLFIRVPRVNQQRVEKELTVQQISFETLSGNAYRLPNGTNLQAVNKLEGLYEVQDVSSQESLAGLNLVAGTKWWDACAGAGGKSLLLLDRCPAIALLVSDIRPSILRNLDERFRKAKIRADVRTKVMDLTQDIDGIMEGESFDGILVDAPCTGSGTWGRTPEMLTQFDEEHIQTFVSLQQRIVDSVVRYLKPDGVLMYVTCSVFEAENEHLVRYLVDKHGLTVEAEGIIKGYDRKSDSMFAARLRNA